MLLPPVSCISTQHYHLARSSIQSLVIGLACSLACPHLSISKSCDALHKPWLCPTVPACYFLQRLPGWLPCPIFFFMYYFPSRNWGKCLKHDPGHSVPHKNLLKSSYPTWRCTYWQPMELHSIQHTPAWLFSVSVISPFGNTVNWHWCKDSMTFVHCCHCST